ncbi:helix-turn-helix domain-containing protein [Nocardia sp. IFM 10818]
MADAHSAIAGYLRERREHAGLTRAELARRAGVSEALIQKLEQGTRPPTATALGALFDALDVPVQVREHAAYLLQPELTAIVPDGYGPDAAELDFLDSIPYPACYQTMPALDCVAANEPYRRAFPGLDAGVNVLVWTLLDPRAREVIGNWETIAHMMVHAFRHLAPGMMPPERIAELTRQLERAPEWERMWAADIPPSEIERRPIVVRSPETGEWTDWHVQLLRCEVPRRPWWMWTMVRMVD